MRWESVQELKSDLARHSLTPASVGASLPAGRPESLVVTGPSIALGAVPTEKEGEFRLAVRVQRRELMKSERLATIVTRAQGEADVQYVGRGFKQQAPLPLQGTCRPVMMGSSVGHHAITAGSVGCFVDTVDGVRLLSNNHVLADEDRAKLGDAIVQPGPHDGGRVPKDVIGALDLAIPLDHRRPNRFDAALATLHDDAPFDNATIVDVGTLSGLADASEAVQVAKVGRTTSTTFGRVVAIDLDDAWFDYETGPLRFDGVIQIAGDDGRFTAGGDSGSLVVTREARPRAIGLHFGGYENGTSVACPLPQLLAEMRASLIS